MLQRISEAQGAQTFGDIGFKEGDAATKRGRWGTGLEKVTRTSCKSSVVGVTAWVYGGVTSADVA